MRTAGPPLVVLVTALAPVLASCGDDGGSGAGPSAPDAPPPASVGAYAGSARCATCHPDEHALWAESQHHLAERDLDPALDGPAFAPGTEVAHGTQTSSAREEDGRYLLTTEGPSGEAETFEVARAFAVEPLWQYLVEVDPGRYQVTELAWDPAEGEWFDVYGDEDRRAGEWGHWTGRAMTWNGRCAQCHNTGFEKNYDFETDTYASTREEMGVGCESCHGPMLAHAEWREADAVGADPHLTSRSPARWMDSCGACHSRRAELTPAYVAGEPFLDHFVPTIPDETDVYYPDAQVRDEDFEYVSFLTSRMWAEGVTCLDCHEPHAGRVRLPGNDLCLRCHGDTLVPEQHMFHAPGTPGGNCVDCHMPETTYMERDPRRDHGFTIPDPWLTLEHGTPNACNRCHTDQDAQWALEAAEAWWGERLDRGSRHRADVVARARAGEEDAVGDLMRMLAPDTHPMWRAIAVGLLAGHLHDPEVVEALLWRTEDRDPLVRTRTAIALTPLAASGLPPVDEALRRLLGDPVRSVRVQAAWALRAEVVPSTRAGRDLAAFLEHGLDDVAGLHRMSLYRFDRKIYDGQLPFLRRAMEWDPLTPVLRRDAGMMLSVMGRPDEAVAELEAAAVLLPEDPGLRFQLAQARYEAGDLDGAEDAFRHTVSLAPEFARAWYNLGLLERERGRPEDALRTLLLAEGKDATDPDPAWAAADLLAELGRTGEALDAAHRALARDPGHVGARDLVLRLTGRRP